MMQHGAGYAFVGQNFEEEKLTLPVLASVFTTELYALFRCIDNILRSRTRRLVVFSGWLSSLQALSVFKTHPAFPHILDQ